MIGTQKFRDGRRLELEPVRGWSGNKAYHGLIDNAAAVAALRSAPRRFHNDA